MKLQHGWHFWWISHILVAYWIALVFWGVIARKLNFEREEEKEDA